MGRDANGPFVRWLGLGKLVCRELQVSYDLPKPSSAPPRHALSCAASRDDCTMLRNNQVQSADLGATFVVVRCSSDGPTTADFSPTFDRIADSNGCDTCSSLKPNPMISTPVLGWRSASWSRDIISINGGL